MGSAGEAVFGDGTLFMSNFMSALSVLGFFVPSV